MPVISSYIDVLVSTKFNIWGEKSWEGIYRKMVIGVAEGIEAGREMHKERTLRDHH